jgi:DNA polymerase-3 subunit delta'
MFEHLEKLSRSIGTSINEESLNQSILLTGREGIGKFAIAQNMAASMLCENKFSACGKCRSCIEVSELRHPDYLFAFPFPRIKPQSKKVTVFSFSDPISSNARYSNETNDEILGFKETKLSDPFALIDFEKKENIPIEIIKDLILSLSKKPVKGGRRVVVILDIDKMAFGASDIFLKIVEEPPENTHIIMTTSRPDNLYPTLISRTSVIKVPPSPDETMKKYLQEKFEINGNMAEFLTRFAAGSPGRAAYYYENEILSRRDIIWKRFEAVLKNKNINEIIEEINLEYAKSKMGFKQIEIDFDIMESIIHDLCLAGKNGLENQMINTDIRNKFEKIKCPSAAALDIWKKCCSEVKRACLVNNVMISSGMSFFFISCAKALQNPAGVQFKIP